MSIWERVRRSMFGPPGAVAITPRMMRSIAPADGWFVRIPEWMRQGMIDESRSVAASLAKWTRGNRARMAEINCIGVEFDPTGDRELFPWLLVEERA